MDTSTVSRVRIERQRHGWSQTRLTMKTGISQSDISAIEGGKRYCPPAWRRRIARALGVPERDLFPDVEPRA